MGDIRIFSGAGGKQKVCLQRLSRLRLFIDHPIPYGIEEENKKKSWC
jgi:hypothetical protein